MVVGTNPVLLLKALKEMFKKNYKMINQFMVMEKRLML